MPRYCYIDLNFGARFETSIHGLDVTENVIRDYRAEGVGSNLEALRDSIRASDEYKLFLPTRQDLETKMSPNAADTFIKDWNERHSPQKSGGASDKFRPR